ncbi:CRISPR-associated protein Cas4 [Listeria monocytogenes]|uniref:CRISPR-associated protein Cas4 n=1 Tax=Listeria monocytogenes TaxID=1639 RepID=UPI00077A846B|nr:CRISPR-associated protein Cas4 [Listeria monocytogenes]EHC5286166.1 CRISPR-associated protein Cas4 [Listeria monocytogenes serotype 1/2a]EAD0096220.1 CRISPR-associated protein Cas4 [Listeria monocytogenes]EAF2388567.1 CRISPR-associated protein Cas4 [Listeria monocytogenes]EAF4460388.1 CRISPR-associated protein Cas4 [Listeria monocytogenes]EAF4478111.1 CRISPR-associated protein Cas4 [Listeria monocytogenes]
MRISGTHVYYYFVCKRKLWCFSKEIRMENLDENVQLGKLLDESSYNREKGQVMIDETVNIDFIKDWKVLHEVKKSKAIEEAGIWQLKYYMYFLKQKGIIIEKGVVDYPKLRQRETIFLTTEDERKIEKILVDIEITTSSLKPPTIIDKPLCKKCAYYEYCYI